MTLGRRGTEGTRRICPRPCPSSSWLLHPQTAQLPGPQTPLSPPTAVVARAQPGLAADPGQRGGLHLVDESFTPLVMELRNSPALALVPSAARGPEEPTGADQE